MIYFKSLILTLFIFTQTIALAQIPSFDQTRGSATGGSEFFVGKNLGRPLVTVNLVNGVQKPGVYHIPVQTDLAQLLSYAGGAGPNSDLEDITIRRRQLGKTQLVNVDLEKILKSTSSIPELQHNDIIHIDQDITTAQTTVWLGIISSLATIALTMVLIDNNN